MVSRSPSENFFDVLGLPAVYAIDRRVLEDAYLARAKKSHPDRVATADVAIQRAAQERTDLLNRAYRALRDPVARAEYLVALGGIDLDRSGPGGAPDPGQAFLIEMIERRDALDACRAKGEQALASFADEIEGEAETVLRRAVDALHANNTELAAQELVTVRYLKRLTEEIEGSLEG